MKNFKRSMNFVIKLAIVLIIPLAANESKAKEFSANLSKTLMLSGDGLDVDFSNKRYYDLRKNLLFQSSKFHNG